MEIWKQIENYPKYEVSTMGRVRHIKHQKIRKFWIHQQGYLMINLINKFGNLYPARVHQLVASTFIGRIKKGLVVDHINRIRTDNRVQNLRIVTTKENTNNRGQEWVDIEKIKKIIDMSKNGYVPEQIYFELKIN